MSNEKPDGRPERLNFILAGGLAWTAKEAKLFPANLARIFSSGLATVGQDDRVKYG